MTTLLESERGRLDELELTVERGLATFVEVGLALLEIRDSRLYREEHDTFETYCRERWQMSRRHANRLVEASKVVEVVGPMGPIPTTERQARELAPLLDEPEQLREAWVEAVERTNGEPTATVVRDVVAERTRSRADGPSVDERFAAFLFGCELPLPARFAEAWDLAGELATVREYLDGYRDRLNAIGPIDPADPAQVFREVDQVEREEMAALGESAVITAKTFRLVPELEDPAYRDGVARRATIVGEMARERAATLGSPAEKA